MKKVKILINSILALTIISNTTYYDSYADNIKKAEVKWTDSDIKAVEDINNQDWKNLYPILDGVENQISIPSNSNGYSFGNITLGNLKGSAGGMQIMEIGGRTYSYFNQVDFGGNVASVGCGPTSIAMLLSTITGQPYSPQSLFNLCLSKGITNTSVGSNGDGLAGLMSSLGYRTRRTHNLNEVRQWLNSGNLAYAGVAGYDYYNGKTLAPWFHSSYGHFVALGGIVNNDFIVLDPGWREHTGLINSNRVDASAKAYWLVETPASYKNKIK